MRQQIIDSIFDRMAIDPDIFFLTADMGINLVEKIQEKFPDRFLNVGIAEQNLIGAAAGLANLGFRPFVYTISNFVVHRCFEQIRNDICLHKYPITLLGTSTGYDNAILGPTHHVVDDWGALKALPGIDIYCPSSVAYAEGLIARIIDINQPAYVRIPKGEFTNFTSVGHSVYIPGSNDEVVLVSYGAPSQICIEVHSDHRHISVLIINRLHPLPSNLKRLLAPHSRIVVVEDHFPGSGLYGSLCQLIPCGNLSSLAPADYSLEIGGFKIDVETCLRHARSS